MKRLIPVLLLASIPLVPPAHADGSVTYQQLRHDAIGNAQLSVSPNGSMMRATQLGAGGTDGFRVRLPENASSWNLEFVADLEPGHTLDFNPISNGLPIAPLNVERVMDGFLATVEFTSSQDTAYHLELREVGELVGGFICYPGGDCEPEDPPPGGGGGGGGTPGPGGIIIIMEEPFPDDDEYDDDTTVIGSGFDQVQVEDLLNLPGTPAACRHALMLDGPMEVTVGNSALGRADQIIITEQTSQVAGRYPYAGFSAIRVQSSVGQIVVTDENAH